MRGHKSDSKCAGIAARIEAGDSVEQIANRFDTTRAYVLRVARREGLSARNDATTEVGLVHGDLRSVMVPRGTGRRRLPHSVQYEPSPSSAKMNCNDRDKRVRETQAREQRHRRMERYLKLERLNKGQPKSKEEIHVAWIKKRHELHKLSKKVGVRLEE